MESTEEAIVFCMLGVFGVFGLFGLFGLFGFFGTFGVFGMLGFFVHGNLAVGVWNESLIARIEPANVDSAITAPHVSRFEVRGKALRGWILIGPEGLETDPQLAHWTNQSLDFVHTLPRK